jgi:hypothetical protein
MMNNGRWALVIRQFGTSSKIVSRLYSRPVPLVKRPPNFKDSARVDRLTLRPARYVLSANGLVFRDIELL